MSLGENPKGHLLKKKGEKKKEQKKEKNKKKNKKKNNKNNKKKKKKRGRGKWTKNASEGRGGGVNLI